MHNANPTRPSPSQADTAEDDQDWCPSEDVMTRWDAETCLSCGYIWGEGA